MVRLPRCDQPERPVTVAAVRDGIWSNIFRFSHRPNGIAGVLHGIPLFRDLDGKELQQLERIVHVRRYAPDEVIFSENDPGAGMYVIRTGKVEIVLNHETASRTVLAELEDGDFFGEMALLGDSTRSATAIAQRPSELIGLFHPDLVEIISLHPAMGARIALGLARTLSERLRYTNIQLKSLTDIRGRNERPLE